MPDSEWSPFGPYAHELASHAGELYRILRAPRGEVPMTANGEPTWTEGDQDAFGVYCDFRAVLGDLNTAEGVYELLETVDRFHAALPFSEGERRWLIDTKRTISRAERTEVLVGMEAIITSNGLRQVVRGGELVRRWSAFRHSTDEFARLGTVEEARHHARDIALRIQPHMPFPDDETTSSTPAS